MEHNITVRGSEVVRYFNKPVLLGDSEAIAKINEYFDNEYNDWLNGNASKLSQYYEDRMARFLRFVDISLERLNGKPSPTEFKYCVDADITFLNGDVLSVRQTLYISSGSAPAARCFGVTFDLTTGELIPFTYFVDIVADDFRSGLLDYAMANIPIGYLDDDWTKEYLGPNDEHSFEYIYDGQTFDISYDYYYEGEAIWLILNHIDKPSYLVKWNGESGDLFDGDLYGSNPNDGAVVIGKIK
jgi:hypothetical protein